MPRARAGLATAALVVLCAALAWPAAAQTPDFALPDRDTPVALVADRVVYDTEANQVIAEGSVEVYYGERTLTASRIVYDATRKRITAEGRIAVRNPDGTVLFADFAELDTDLREGLIRGAQLVMRNRAKFAAVEGQRVDDRYNVLTKAVFSACAVCEADPTPLWRIRASRIVHDSKTHDVHYEDATFDVLGVPVFWLPYFRHPDPEIKRRSGFLAPDVLQSSVFGYAVKTPYYWVIDEQSDATITPFLTTDDGPILEGEYRRAFVDGRLQFSGSVSSDNYDGEEELRGHVFANGLFGLGDGYETGFDVNMASDDAYLRRYEISEADRLTSEAFVRHSDPRGYAELSAVRFQSLRDDEPFGEIPMALPSFEARRVFPGAALGGDIGIGFDGYGLLRPDGQDTARVSASADWRRDEIGPAGVVFGAFAYARGDFYQVRDSDEETNRLTRLAPLAGVEARWPLARRWGDATHVVEPIAQAIAAPYGLTETPNEDSQIVEFDDTNLFDPLRFPGNDGWEEGPRLNLGVRYERIGDDGLQVSAAAGQVLRPAAVDSFASGVGLNGGKSDYVGAWSVALPPHFRVLHRFRFDDDFQINRNEISGEATWRDLTVSGAYRFLEGNATEGVDRSIHEASFGGEYAVTDRWIVGAKARYDIENNSWIRAGGEITYRTDCLDAALFVDRRFTESRDAPKSTTIGLRLRLWAFGADARPRPVSDTCAPVTR